MIFQWKVKTMNVKIDGRSTLMFAIKNIKRNNYLDTTRVATVFSTIKFKMSTQERHYIFVFF